MGLQYGTPMMGWDPKVGGGTPIMVVGPQNEGWDPNMRPQIGTETPIMGDGTPIMGWDPKMGGGTPIMEVGPQ